MTSCPAKPDEVTAQENFDKVYRILMESRQIPISETEETTGLTHGSIVNIIHDE